MRKSSVFEGMVTEVASHGQLHVREDVGAGQEPAIGVVDVDFDVEGAGEWVDGVGIAHDGLRGEGAVGSIRRFG